MLSQGHGEPPAPLVSREGSCALRLALRRAPRRPRGRHRSSARLDRGQRGLFREERGERAGRPDRAVAAGQALGSAGFHRRRRGARSLRSLRRGEREVLGRGRGHRQATRRDRHPGAARAAPPGDRRLRSRWQFHRALPAPRAGGSAVARGCYPRIADMPVTALSCARRPPRQESRVHVGRDLATGCASSGEARPSARAARRRPPG